ncbi:hypothetical protein FCG41_19955 [Azotobacter chroococcum]|nr:hypothetical protein FCG41_19955 [Azotobacter chroococcum]
MIYTVACMLLARQFIRNAESRRTDRTVEFSQSGAANALGTEWGSFHHVFYSTESVIEAFRVTLSNSLKEKFGCPELEDIVFKDVDRDLESPETRTFFRTVAKETSRRTGFVLLCTFTRTANIQGVRWWILVSGVRDPNKLFWRYVFSPISVPFVVLPYIRRQYDPLSGLTTIYPGFFNAIDLLTRARELQFVAFETLIEVLESFGVDTTDLKQQKGNILNINVSGGQTSFGSVVQGAMNKVTGAVGGAKS